MNLALGKNGEVVAVTGTKIWRAVAGAKNGFCSLGVWQTGLILASTSQSVFPGKTV
jgi:hypothetical protein